MDITIEQLRANTKGRATWLVIREPDSDRVLRGIERVRLSKLCALLTPRKVQSVRLELDRRDGTLEIEWQRHDGGRGRLKFRDRIVPRLAGCGPARYQKFRYWTP